MKELKAILDDINRIWKTYHQEDVSKWDKLNDSLHPVKERVEQLNNSYPENLIYFLNAAAALYGDFGIRAAGARIGTEKGSSASSTIIDASVTIQSLLKDAFQIGLTSFCEGENFENRIRRVETLEEITKGEKYLLAHPSNRYTIEKPKHKDPTQRRRHTVFAAFEKFKLHKTYLEVASYEAIQFSLLGMVEDREHMNSPLLFTPKDITDGLVYQVLARKDKKTVLMHPRNAWNGFYI